MLELDTHSIYSVTGIQYISVWLQHLFFIMMLLTKCLIMLACTALNPEMVTLKLKVITILVLLIFKISKQRDPDPGLRMAMWVYTHF